MKRTLLFLSLFYVAACTAAYAQTHFGGGLQIGVPTGDFRENTNSVGVGAGLNAYFPVAPKVPVFFGLNFGYMIYGTNTQRINENINLTTSNGSVIGRIPVNFNVTTNNNWMNGNVALRVKAPLPQVQPYAEGAVGFNYLYTRTRIVNNSPSNNPTNPNQTQYEVVNARTQLQSFVLSYGGGGGVMLKFGNFGLDLRCLYMLGGEAEYYDRSQTQSWRVQIVSANGNQNTVEPQGTAKKSRTDALFLTMGISLSL